MTHVTDKAVPAVRTTHRICAKKSQRLPTEREDGRRCDKPLRVPANPSEILHGLKAVQDDAGKSGIRMTLERVVSRRRRREWDRRGGEHNERLILPDCVILNPGFSRVKDPARIGKGLATLATPGGQCRADPRKILHGLKAVQDDAIA